MNIKIWPISRPRFAIRQKLAASRIIRVWTYEKVGLVIRLKSESNTCILDSVFDSIFDSGSSNSTSIHQFYYSASTQLRSLTFCIRLDDKSRVGFADIWLTSKNKGEIHKVWNSTKLVLDLPFANERLLEGNTVIAELGESHHKRLLINRHNSGGIQVKHMYLQIRIDQFRHI